MFSFLLHLRALMFLGRVNADGKTIPRVKDIQESEVCVLQQPRQPKDNGRQLQF